ncbi:hypothetical protein T03_6649 [Trichinella britovi]|uniref:Uncharacterized protein n=1 Tax=Trichinella britovi TaxID=45882 RepID=A0A0V1CFN5_TRIBR|nr:hypothetical protein T03_6649 [Trichinella britovi]
MLATQLAIPNCPVHSGIELEDHQPNEGRNSEKAQRCLRYVIYRALTQIEEAASQTAVMLEDTFPEVDALEEVLQVWFSPVEEMSATRIAAMKFLDEAEAVKSREVKSSPKEM